MPYSGILSPSAIGAALKGDYADYLDGCVKAALERRVWSSFDDDLGFLRPWGFDLHAITTPVTVWQGEQSSWRSRAGKVVCPRPRGGLDCSGWLVVTGRT